MRFASTTLSAAALLLAFLMFCALLPAQSPSGLQSLVAVAPDQKRAQKALGRGEKAEAQGRIEEALNDYDEAVRYAPHDAAIAAKSAVLRSKLVRQYAENAERLALAGNVPQAAEQLRQAMRIDPTNGVVAERLSQMEAMIDDEPAPRPPTVQGLPRLNVRDGKHDFDLQGDTKTVYEQVALAFGVKAAFDPDLTPRHVRLRVDGVDFNTTMSLLGEQTGTFWRPLDASLIFVAPDTPDKRKQYGLQAEQTFSLPASVAPEEMTELLRVLREITGSTRIELDSHNHSITMRDSLDKLALAGQIIHQVERARGEIMLDVELLEVDRNKATQLGVVPPSSAQAFLISPNEVKSLQQSSDLANALTILGQLFSAQGISTVPGFTLFGGGNSTFLLTLPAVAADFSDALTLVQSGQQVLLRAQDAKPVSFFVGDRYPVTLSLLSGSLGTGTGTPASTPTNPNQILAALPTSTSFPQTTFAVGNNPVALAAGTLSGGTLPDLAVVNKNDNSISILLNQDNGNFTAQANSPFVLAKNETGPVAIAAAALGNTLTDSAGVTVAPIDLVIANSTSNNVTVLLGNNDGTFTEAAGSPYKVGNDPSAIVVADFNGDGNLDFAVTNRGDNTISVFQGNGNGGFTQAPASPFALTNNSTTSEKEPVAMVTANFRNVTLTTNNNTTAEAADLAIVNEASNNVTILLDSVDSNGNTIFTEQTSSPIAVGNTPVAIATGDLNTDGIPDLAVVNQADNTVSILLGNSSANATFSAATGSPLPTSATPAGIVVANFTGGEVPSLAVTNEGVSTLGIYVGLGGGTFSTRLEITTPASPSAIITSVLTSGGLPDVALTALGTTANQGFVAVILDSSTFATGTTPTQTPYPGSEFIDLGVKVKATPTLHPNREVTLQLEFEIRSLSGDSINGIPIITNRTLSQTVRVKEDETTLISGLLDRDEARTLSGLPGLASVPGAGYGFGNNNNTLQNTEFMILVTPHKLRIPIRVGSSIYAGRGDTTGRASSGAGVPLPEPAPAAPPTPQTAPPAPNPSPAPPGEQPPTTQPPATQPPATQPPAEQPPANQPPARPPQF